MHLLKQFRRKIKLGVTFLSPSRVGTTLLGDRQTVYEQQWNNRCIQSYRRLVKTDPSIIGVNWWFQQKTTKPDFRVAVRTHIACCHTSYQWRCPPGAADVRCGRCEVTTVRESRSVRVWSATRHKGEFSSAPNWGAPRKPPAPAAPGPHGVPHRHWPSPPWSGPGPPGVRTADPSGWQTDASPGGLRPARASKTFREQTPNWPSLEFSKTRASLQRDCEIREKEILKNSQICTGRIINLRILTTQTRNENGLTVPRTQEF